MTDRDITEGDIEDYRSDLYRSMILWISAGLILALATLVKFEVITRPIFFMALGVIVSIYLAWKMIAGKKTSREKELAVDIEGNWFDLVPKLLLFVAYHTLTISIAYWLTMEFLWPMANFPWHWLLEWLRQTLIVLFLAGTATYAFKSILSSWTLDALDEDEIGQLSISGWMPWFGQNLRNGPLGVFTGLPSIFVNIIRFSAKAPKIVRASAIQIPIYGDVNGKLFEAEFTWSAKVQIGETRKYILNPIREAKIFKECKGTINKEDVKSDWDIVNMLERTLTGWTNNLKERHFASVADLKPKKDEIENMLNKVVSKAIFDSHGINFTEFFLESIEIPEVQIKQQNEDAKEKAATVAREEREDLDNRSLIEQANKLREASRGDNGEMTMTFKEALDRAQIQQGKIRATKASISGAGKGKRGSLGGVFLDGDD